MTTPDVNALAALVLQVRRLIPDIELIPNPNRPGSVPEYIFSDLHLQDLLLMANYRPRRAAADAVEALGTSEALILKVITTEDLATDGAKLMNAYVNRAARMREQDDKDLMDLNNDFFIVPYELEPTHWEPR